MIDIHMEPTLQAYTSQKTGSSFRFSPKHVRIFAIVATFLIAVGGIWWYVNKYIYKPKAGTEDVTVQFTPASRRVEPNQEFTLPVRLTADATKVISGAQLYITYDDTVEYIPQNLSQLTTDFSDLVVQDVTSPTATTKQLKLTVTSPTATQLKNISLLNLKFKAKSQIGQVTFKVDTKESQVSGTAAAYLFNLLTEDMTIGIGQDVVIPTPTLSTIPVTPQPTIPIPTVPPVSPNPGANYGTTLYAPVFSNNLTWGANQGKQYTQVYINNPGETAASITLTVYGDNGAELKKIPVTIPAKGNWNTSAQADWAAIGGGAETSGWMKIISDKPVFATNRQLLLSGTNPNAAVYDVDDELFTTAPSNRSYTTVYTRKVVWGANQGKQFTQLHIANPSENETAQVTVNVYDSDQAGSAVLLGKLTVSLGPKATWNSYDKAEWNNVGGNTNIVGGIVEVLSSTPVVALTSTTLREGDDYRSKIMHFDHEMMASTESNSVANTLYSPFYSAKTAWGANQGNQFSQVVVGNPNDSAVTVQIKVYKPNQTGAVNVFTMSKTLAPKGVWNSYDKAEWNNDLGAINGTGWVELIAPSPIVAVNRVTLRKEVQHNSYLNDFNDHNLSSRVSTAFYAHMFARKTPWGANQGKQFANPIIMNPNTKDLIVVLRAYTAPNATTPGTMTGQMAVEIKAGKTWMADSNWYSMGGTDEKFGWYEIISASNMPFMALSRVNFNQGDDPNSQLLQFDEELAIAVGSAGTIDNSNPFPVVTPQPTAVPPSPSPIACSPTNACPSGHSCISNVCRPLYCQSATVTNRFIDSTKPSTITSTANTNQIRSFGYAFYNLDNLDANGVAKPIHFEDNTHYIQTVNPSSPTNTASTTVDLSAINRPDKNNGGQIPKRVQVNAYFTGPGGLSAPEAACVVNLTTEKADVELKLKLRFQGIVQKVPQEYNNMRVKVTLVGGGLSQPVSATGDFKQTSSELWEGSVGFTGNFAASASNYAILVKGPKHLQRKICALSAQDNENGFYTCANSAQASITLKKGVNEVDLSNIIQPAGDLPINGNQSGVIDSVDLVYLRSRLGSKNAADFATGDLNLDGIIDSQDHSLPVKVLDLNKNTDDE